MSVPRSSSETASIIQHLHGNNNNRQSPPTTLSVQSVSGGKTQFLPFYPSFDPSRPPPNPNFNVLPRQSMSFQAGQHALESFLAGHSRGNEGEQNANRKQQQPQQQIKQTQPTNAASYSLFGSSWPANLTSPYPQWSNDDGAELNSTGGAR